MSEKYAALRQQILNPANGSRDHLRKIALQLLDELAEREADKARIAELEKWVRGVEESMISASDRAESADKRVAELEARKLVPVMYKSMELLKKEGLELIRDGLVEATVLESMCMAGALLSATPAQPVEVPDDKTITAYFDTLALDTARDIMCDVNRRSDFLGGEIQLLARIQCRIDEACRAAMHGSTISNYADIAIDEASQSFGNSEQLEPVSQPYKLVGEVVAWDHPTKERSVDFRWLNYDVAPGTKLYAMSKE